MVEKPLHKVAVQLDTDVWGFVRRRCPVCARTFGVRNESAVVQSTFVAAFRHANADEAPALPTRHCPYCGQTAPANAFFTAPQRGYIEACAKSMASHVRHEQLLLAERHLHDNPYITFRPVKPRRMPPPPLEEPDDLRVIPLHCCEEDLEVGAAWREDVYCPYCRDTQPA